MRIVSLSDTHEQHRLITVPDGDVLLHAGDFTYRGDVKAILDFAKWMGEQPHPIKIVIPGNHDLLFEKDWNFAKALMGSSGAILLNQTTTKVGDLIVYGEPRQPEFYNWAFNVPREDMKRVWDLAPRRVDVLLTHGPPMGAGDQMSRDKRVGDEHMRNYILETKPKLVVCGHVHEGYGRYLLGSTEVINASNLDGQYKYTNPPIVVDL